MTEPFTWRDGERTIRFGRGAANGADDLLGSGYVLLTTERARLAAPAIAAAAIMVCEVAPGRVDELAAALLTHLQISPLDARHPLVALGGGRVIDVAKAIAAARGDVQVAAVPTTLSAAEMTQTHRHAAGVDPSTPRVRPAIVINDPALSASQPGPALAGSAANALAHAVEGAGTLRATPVPTLAGRDAARRIALAYRGAVPDRDELALAALLSGYTIDANGYGLHHVLAQTLVRASGLPHGMINSALLPHTLRALDRRGNPAAAGMIELAHELAARAEARSLRALGVHPDALESSVLVALQRPDLHHTPPVPTADEVRALYRAAW